MIAMRTLLPWIYIVLLFVSSTTLAKDLFSKEEKQIIITLKSKHRFIDFDKKLIALKSRRRMRSFLNQMMKTQKELLDRQISKGPMRYLDYLDQKESFEKHIKKLIFKGVINDR